MTVLKILLERHNYKGELSIPAIIAWLEEHQVYISTSPYFEEDDDLVTFVGYQSCAYMPPFDSVYKASIYKTRSESIIMLITQILTKGYVQ